MNTFFPLATLDKDIQSRRIAEKPNNLHARNGKEWLEKMVRGPVVKDARHPARETIVLETVQIIYRSRGIECDFDRPSFFD